MQEDEPNPPVLSYPVARRQKERGQSLVELALVLPIFLLIVIATIDFGWAFQRYITATNAAREGARLGVTGAEGSAIQTRVIDRSSGVVKAGGVTVTNAKGASGTPVTVRAEFDYHYITPLGGLINLVSGGDSIRISTQTTMRIE